ncbi:MAG: hypothetical protein NTV77_01490 [Candidatus Azambacteria bacterium]|nr:hypothetical protein [Candidatus Azambacteria bacterium]
MKNKPKLTLNNIAHKITFDRVIRKEVTRKSHLWFFNIFLSHYLRYEFAPFHKEMFRLTENAANKLLVVMAFRGSGKSTILNLSYTLWSILGIQQKKFVLIISKTQDQAKNHFANIKTELENNRLLSSDLGPFKAESDDRSSYSLELPNMGAKITSVPSRKSIRGMKHGFNRPDLIICDDIEDTLSMKDKELESAIYEWFANEVVTAGDNNTNIVIIGNLLGKNSLLVKLKQDIDEGRRKGIFKAYPLLDDNKKILWPGKYPNIESINRFKEKISDEIVWDREYLLRGREKFDLSPLTLFAEKSKESRESMKKESEEDCVKPYKIAGEEYQISAPILPMSLTEILNKIENQKNLEKKELENKENKEQNIEEIISEFKEIIRHPKEG